MKNPRLVLFVILNMVLAFTCSCGGSGVEKFQEILSQTGSVYVATAKDASKLARFEVKKPFFLPEGFKPGEFPGGSFQVFKLGDPKDTLDKEYPYSVLQYYYKSGKVAISEPYFSIHQSRNAISGPGDEPETVNGIKGKKGIFTSNGREMMYLTWNDGTTYFIVESWLIDTLDENTVIMMAASIR
jgi:hypothetical protein